jgi:uncharacterized membrane protein YdjX (TVP38/TMEM64 family)
MKIRPSLIFTILISLALMALLIGGLSGEQSIDFEALKSVFDFQKDSKLAILTVIFVFVFASFIGAPQWALITACVLGFGPLMGAFYAWIATLTSASVNFGLARILGQKRLMRFTGPRLKSVLEKVEKKGLLWSFVVRLVPTGPFILVNLAAGVSSIRYFSFIAGTALGIIPKILVVALIAKGVFVGLDRQLISLLFIGLAMAAITLTLWLQNRFRKSGPMA